MFGERERERMTDNDNWRGTNDSNQTLVSHSTQFLEKENYK